MHRWWWAWLLAVPAEAGRKRSVPPPEPGPSPAAAAPAAEVPTPAPTYGEPLFPAILPVDPGPLPTGLAHAGAQACAACHPTAWRSWSHGAHAGPPPSALALTSMGLAGCDACHLPLVSQHERLEIVTDGRLERSSLEHNPSFDPTAWLEGVTCAACHVRGGQVLASSPEAAARPAPHPLAWSPELGGDAGCAACHQLRMEGAAEPLYDTVGEWTRAGFAERGIGCTDCHGGGAADGGPPDHDPARALEEGLSVLLAAGSLTLERGAPPTDLLLTLVNTGAGHAIPTGSPWKGLQVRWAVEGPPDRKGIPISGPETRLHLARTLSSAEPFATTGDNRLLPGARVDLRLALALPTSQPAGAWTLILQVHETLQGNPGDLRLERRWPLIVR